MVSLERAVIFNAIKALTQSLVCFLDMLLGERWRLTKPEAARRGLEEASAASVAAAAASAFLLTPFAVSCWKCC